MSEVNKIKELIYLGMMDSKLSNDDLVEIIKHAGAYGNIMSVKDYSKENNISVQAVYRYRNVVDLWGFKFVMEND
jgi:hypothetical protein